MDKMKNYTRRIRVETNKRKNNLFFINSSIQCLLQLKQFKDNILKIVNIYIVIIYYYK